TSSAGTVVVPFTAAVKVSSVTWRSRSPAPPSGPAPAPGWAGLRAADRADRSTAPRRAAALKGCWVMGPLSLMSLAGCADDLLAGGDDLRDAVALRDVDGEEQQRVDLRALGDRAVVDER